LDAYAKPKDKDKKKDKSKKNKKIKVKNRTNLNCQHSFVISEPFQIPYDLLLKAFSVDT
jgi:hypothetical protein